jgi:hypothetical protein
MASIGCGTQHQTRLEKFGKGPQVNNGSKFSSSTRSCSPWSWRTISKMTGAGPSTSAIFMHRQNPQSVMAWDKICTSGKKPLVFADQGVKINQEVYHPYILEVVVLL